MADNNLIYENNKKISLTDDCFTTYLPESKDNHAEWLENEELGINLAGYINSEKGLGEGIRSDIRCLQHAGIPFVLNNFIDSGSVNTEMKNANLTTTNPYRINLIHINADQVFEFIKHKGYSYLSNHYNIGYWAWELSQFPEEWYDAFRVFDEIWVPSSFVQDSLGRISPIPVVKIPHSVRENMDQPSAFDRSYFGLPQNDFAFLFIFDFESSAARKNPLGTVKAFKKAFSEKDNAVLVLKSSHSERYPDDFQMLREAADNEKIIIIDRVMTGDEVQALMQQADCYVSLHRSEGFGLTIAEAMGMGKPVIATAYSGNTDFMTPWNSYSVKYNLVEIDHDHGPYKKGYVWADPDLDHTAYLMRRVYDNREEALKIGQAAREYIQSYFNPSAVGRIFQERLDHIAKNNMKQFLLPLHIANHEIENLRQKISSVGVNQISVQSKKPIIRFLVSYYKRFIRKSTFWLLDPLISRLREIDNSMLELHKKSLGIQQTFRSLIYHDLEDLLIKIGQITEKESTIRLQQDGIQEQVDQHECKIREIGKQIEEIKSLWIKTQDEVQSPSCVIFLP